MGGGSGAWTAGVRAPAGEVLLAGGKTRRAGFRAPEPGAGTGSVAGFHDEEELAPSAPYASTTIVTRRFCDRPSRVLLSAIGSLSP